MNDKFVFDPKDPSKKYEKNVKEFITDIAYESSVVITNTSSSPIEVSLITQIPTGSIPIYSLTDMNVEDVHLNPL